MSEYQQAYNDAWSEIEDDPANFFRVEMDGSGFCEVLAELLGEMWSQRNSKQARERIERSMMALLRRHVENHCENKGADA